MKVGGGVGERSKNVKKTMTCVLRVPNVHTWTHITMSTRGHCNGVAPTDNSAFVIVNIKRTFQTTRSVRRRETTSL